MLRWIGPGRPSPAPITSARDIEAASSTSSTSSAAASIASRGGEVLGDVAPRLREHDVGEVGDRHGQVALAEVDPDHRARGLAEADQRRGPARAGLVALFARRVVDHQARLAHL